VHLSERDEWLVQTLRSLGSHLPARLRTMVLALSENRCRQGVLTWQGPQDLRRLEAEVQLEAAAAWGVPPEEVGFDFHVDEASLTAGTHDVHWAACLLEELTQWRQQARSAGWRLPVVETEQQAARRAATHLCGETGQHWAESPQDWQFSRSPQRALADLDWPQLQSGPMWQPLVACGAALGALL
jgi:Tfp pilus assembly PilM family ATPase